MKPKALFLDRDGVINQEINYLYRIEDFVFIEGIFDLCKKFQDNHFKIIVITNQAGIARKFYTYEDYQKLTDWMIKQFSNEGILISKVYHCPHHPDITGECKCRKPNTQMIVDAQQEFKLNLEDCILIGDKISDIEAGKKAGIGLNVLIKPNNLQSIVNLL